MAIMSSKGFSLIEALIATTVLSVGLLGLIGMFEAGYKALDGGESRTIAAKLARDQMERLRATPALAIDPPEEDFQRGMVRKWSEVKSLSDPNIWIVTVEVFWHNLQKQSRTVRLRSFRSS